MPKKPPLSRKDLKLWQKVADTVTPLDGKSAQLKALITSLDQHKPASTKANQAKANQVDPSHPVQRRRAGEAELNALKAAGLAGSERPRPAKAPPLSGIDRKEKKRILRGSLAIDARLDLHGMTQREAHNALFGFLRSSQARGHKHVLVITGKGSQGDPHPFSHAREKGVLRRVVPGWLSEPDIRSIIVGFEEAHPSLGGGGALHIRLRRRTKSG